MLTITVTRTTVSATTTRTICGDLELATFKNGRTEVYTLDPSDPPAFQGYYDQLCSSPLAARVHPLLAKHIADHRASGWAG